MQSSIHHIAIFASGRGSNAEAIIAYFEGSAEVRVSLIVSNRPDAGVLDIARAHSIDTLVIDRPQLNDPDFLLSELRRSHIDFIALAGFLWLIPSYLVQAYSGAMVNIHPSLLPSHGGSGMYGMRVHEAVLAAGDGHTGITIHYVDEHYDEGAYIYQAQCAVAQDDTASVLAARVAALEHEHYPRVIAEILNKKSVAV